MRVLFYIPLCLLLLSSCFPEEKIEVAMREHIETMTDMNFKNTIGLIEIHKLRYGTYPNSLKDIKFLSVWDTAAFSGVQYIKLESGYELNTVSQYSDILNDEKKYEDVGLHYPPEFWTGLGCVKSNAK